MVNYFLEVGIFFILLLIPGIFFNLVMCFVNISCIGNDNRFTRWWLRENGGKIIFLSVWGGLVVASFVLPAIVP